MIGTVNIIYQYDGSFLADFFQQKIREFSWNPSGAIGDGLKET